MSNPESTGVTFEPLHASAERVLGDFCQSKVAIARADLLSEPDRRNRIWRCTTVSQRDQAPRTVIVKQVAATIYDPDDAKNFDTWRFFGDWAGAAFLSEAGDEALGPRFYGGDRQAGFIILEDLGEHRSLVQPLLEGDRAGATRALLSYASQLGKIHAYGYGRERQFDDIRRSLNPKLLIKSDQDDSKEQQEIDAKIDGINSTLAQFDVQIDDVAREEVHKMVAAMHHPDLFRTFIHADPCPDNIFYDGISLRLIDFEFSRYGHALHDALYGRIPFPTCWCCNRVVSDVMAEMERVYRARFGAACPAVLNDQLYYAEAAAVAGFWAITGLEWLEMALKEDSTWGIAGVRARIVTRLNTFVDACANGDHWVALQGICRQIQPRLSKHWPDTEALPFYPAFRN